MAKKIKTDGWGKIAHNGIQTECDYCGKRYNENLTACSHCGKVDWDNFNKTHQYRRYQVNHEETDDIPVA